eukprot:354895-Chlamydomonas_euryale.AAC.1
MRRCYVLSAPPGFVIGHYLHMSPEPGLGSIACAVAIGPTAPNGPGLSGDAATAATELAAGIAMHGAGMRPGYLSRGQVRCLLSRRACWALHLLPHASRTALPVACKPRCWMGDRGKGWPRLGKGSRAGGWDSGVNCGRGWGSRAALHWWEERQCIREGTEIKGLRAALAGGESLRSSRRTGLGGAAKACMLWQAVLLWVEDRMRCGAARQNKLSPLAADILHARMQTSHLLVASLPVEPMLIARPPQPAAAPTTPTDWIDAHARVHGVQVPPEALDAERKVLTEQAAGSGKPAAVVSAACKTT